MVLEAVANEQLLAAAVDETPGSVVIAIVIVVVVVRAVTTDMIASANAAARGSGHSGSLRVHLLQSSFLAR
jgi:hypothetical protein